MSLLDTIKGFLGGDRIQGLLESTGLGEHVEGILGEGTAVAENFGVDVGQATESLGLDGITESLPGGITETLPGGPVG